MVNAALSQLLYLVFLAGILMVFAGQKVVDSLQLRVLQPVVDFINNNNGTVMLVLFFCNMVSSQLVATGAFEVTYNGETVYSGLETHQPPDIGYLIQLAQRFVTTKAHVPLSA